MILKDHYCTKIKEGPYKGLLEMEYRNPRKYLKNFDEFIKRSKTNGFYSLY